MVDKNAILLDDGSGGGEEVRAGHDFVRLRRVGPARVALEMSCHDRAELSVLANFWKGEEGGWVLSTGALVQDKQLK